MYLLVNFGLAVGMAVIMAFLADIIVTPAFVSLVYRNKEKMATHRFGNLGDQNEKTA